ncbi:CRAL-TRIO domain-containing protein [Stachybotrys elegans]|uniref:CRAL-TRIO domain-containing protein n=1 Tax=Stachybotrys elegans TaxID=80388 RepID=A0A8K0SXG1_9HYPO|nr:CRAL-TRIO domain-containing protein [Stachybotrys elegans]
MAAAENVAVPAARIMSNSSVPGEVGYPNGHLGYLTDHEKAAFQSFKALLEEKGFYNPGPPASHDDPLLLRYLRARRWVPEDAFTQFSETERWREANDIDVLYHTIDLDAYEESRRLYPQWTGRRDRRGIPLYVFEIQHLDNKTVSAYEKKGAQSTFSEAKTDGKTAPGLLRLFALYENLTRFQMPFCTQLTDREFPDVPITMSTNIVDISNVGLKQFWNLKSHMQAASQLATAHYPETLDRIFVIGAPVFFNTVWGWIKRWFDPITVSKIFILSPHEVKPTLETFIDVRNIPKKYGGELDYTWGDLGVTDPAWDGVVEWENGYTGFPSGPMIWEDDGDRVVCIALGAKDGKPRRERVCTVPRAWPPTATAVTTEGTQTDDATESAVYKTTSRDDATQTDLTGEAMEKLTINDEKTAAVPPISTSATTAA